MRVLFCGQVPKDDNYPESVEDVAVVVPDLGRLAISDGASESFDSKTWAKLLAENFSSSPEMHTDWLAEAIRRYNDYHDTSMLSWSRRAAFDRGSFATLLGVEIFPSRAELDLLSVGDTLAVLLSNSKRVDSFPYKSAEEFLQRPELFCTAREHNAFFEDPTFNSSHRRTWRHSHLCNAAVLCMTDALAEWALKMEQDGAPQWGELLSIKKLDDLQYLVKTERQHRRMRRDDVTLISLRLLSGSQDELPNT